jgi:hypothetical protein
MVQTTSTEGNPVYLKTTFLAAMALAASGVLVPMTSAMADTPHCVTRAEFNRVHRGMYKAHVHRIFDFKGVFYGGGAGGYDRAYRECGPHGNVCRVVIEYQANARTNVARLYSKRWNATCS